jgi:phospholipid/cholesterol/gamma-HCH transport system ATP-binding protein
MIRFVNLKKSFGNRQVLNGISFEVRAGEIVFIIGTSGTGKSVLLKNLVGLLAPDAGEIWIDNQNIVGFSEEEFLSIRRQVGMVFQQPALFDSLTVFENVAFGLRRLENLTGSKLNERVLESLDHVGLKDLAHRYPPSLSYGQQKRVSLARTVAIRPKVLLFDEPTTGLDPISTTSVNDLIQSLSRKLNTTSIVVSHDMRCALSIADRIIVLDKGLVVASGPPETLKHNTHPLVQDFLKEAILEGY